MNDAGESPKSRNPSGVQPLPLATESGWKSYPRTMKPWMNTSGRAMQTLEMTAACMR